LMGTAGGSQNPPLKDTVLIRPNSEFGSEATVQFTAGNPGRWLYHCHNLDHMMMGMMTLFDYTGDHDLDEIGNSQDIDPLSAYAALTVPDTASSYQRGSALAISVQWHTGESVDFCYGAVLPQPIPAGSVGELGIWPIVSFVRRVADATNMATLSLPIPGDPGLSGIRFGLQAVTTTSLAPGYRLSTYQPITIY